MPYLDTPELRLHYESFGDGMPVTVFGHGVSSSIEDTRFLSSGVRGTKTFLHFRGHGDSGDPAEGYDYAGVRRDLRAVADHVSATAAVGISMGAGAILGVLSETPDRFDRIVLVLPAGLDRPRTDGSMNALLTHAEMIEKGDVDALTDFLHTGLPEDLASIPDIRSFMAERAVRQLANPGLPRALRGLPTTPPVPDREVLRQVTARCLVISQEDDEVHPASVGREIAAVIPGCELHVFPRPYSMLRERDMLRDLVAGLLNGDRP